MNTERDQADLLDAAIERLLVQSDNIPHTSPQSEETLSVMRDLRLTAENTPKRAEFVGELEARLLFAPAPLNNTNQVARSDAFKTRLRVGLGTWLRRWRNTGNEGYNTWYGHRAGALGLGAAAIGLLVIVGVAYLLLRPQTVSAGEILARAEHAAENAGAFGLNSYHGFGTGTNGPSSAGGAPMQWQREVWFQAPDRLRWEFAAEVGNPSTPGVTQEVRFTIVENGRQGWTYDHRSKEIHTFDPTGMVGLGRPGSVFGATDLTSLLQKAGREYETRLMGTQEVVGRPVYVLEMRPKSDTDDARWLASITTWIDQRTYVQLKAELKDLEGLTIAQWAYDSFEENIPIDQSLFLFTETFATPTPSPNR